MERLDSRVLRLDVILLFLPSVQDRFKMRISSKGTSSSSRSPVVVSRPFGTGHQAMLPGWLSGRERERQQMPEGSPPAAHGEAPFPPAAAGLQPSQLFNAFRNALLISALEGRPQLLLRPPSSPLPLFVFDLLGGYFQVKLRCKRPNQGKKTPCIEKKIKKSLKCKFSS